MTTLFNEKYLFHITVVATSVAILLSLFVHSHDPFLRALPSEYEEARAELMVINSYGKAETTYDCGRPIVRLSIGNPTVALNVGIDPSADNKGLVIWSNKIHSSRSISFVSKTQHGWNAIDTVHAGSFRTQRGGAGADNYAKGFTVPIHIANTPVASGCDGLLGISPFGNLSGIFGRFNIAQFTASFLTLMSADPTQSLHNLQSELEIPTLFTLQSPVHANITIREDHSTLGVIKNAKIVIDGKDCHNEFEAEVGVWEVPSLVVGQQGSAEMPSILVTGNMILGLRCLCGNQDASSIFVSGLGLDTHDLCGYTVVTDSSQDKSSLTIPWTSMGSGLGYALDSRGSRQVKSHWLSSTKTKDMVLFYTLFLIFCIGALVWYLRDKLAPCPMDLQNTPLIRQAFDHLITEVKLELMAGVTFVLLLIFRNDVPATTADLYTSFSFTERVVTSMFLSVYATSYSLWVHNKKILHLEHCACLSLSRSYAVSCTVSAVVSELGRYCVTGVTRHMLAAAMWAWNVRSQIDFVFRFVGMKFVVHHIRTIVYDDLNKRNSHKRVFSMPDPLVFLIIGCACHCGFYLVADFSDVCLGLATTAMPVYGTRIVYAIVTMFSYDTASQLIQRYKVAALIQTKTQ